MRVALIYIFIVFFLFSCRKNKFEGCENYNTLVGEWHCIDTEFDDLLIIKKNGDIITHFTTERNKIFKSNKCTFHESSGEIPSYYRLAHRDSVSFILVNDSFDTILGSGGAYNNNLIIGPLDSYRRYVKTN